MFQLACRRLVTSAATGRPAVAALSLATSTTMQQQIATIRHASSSSSSSLDNLSKVVANVTPEKLEENEELKEFVKANFPHVMDPNYKPPKPPHVSTRGSPGLDPPEIPEEDLPEPDYARNIRPLTTYLRDAENETNSRRSRYLRYHRLIPGLLHGGDPTRGIYSYQPESKLHVKTPWYLLERELDRFHREFECRVYELTVLSEEDDSVAVEPQLVVPDSVQRHPVKSSVYCVNYVRYHAGRPIKVPIRQINAEESPALKRDGYILPIQRAVEIFVEEGADIPTALELECTGLQVKNVIRKDRLVLPLGVRLSDRVIKRGDDYIIGVVDGRGRGADDTT